MQSQSNGNHDFMAPYMRAPVHSIHRIAKDRHIKRTRLASEWEGILRGTVGVGKLIQTESHRPPQSLWAKDAKAQSCVRRQLEPPLLTKRILPRVADIQEVVVIPVGRVVSLRSRLER